MVQYTPEDYDKLPEDERSRLDATMRALLQLVFRHTGAIAISEGPGTDGQVNTASGFLLEIGDRHYFATAEHVLAETEERRKDHPKIRWQVGQLQFDPSIRVAFRDSLSDRLLLAVHPSELAMLALPALSASAGWPPPKVTEDSFVAVCGYPAQIRERPSDSQFLFKSFAATFNVTSSGPNYCICQWNRGEFLTIDEPGAPPPGTELGGMSGGPVLLLGGISFPPVGVVSQFQSSFELLRVATFENIRNEDLQWPWA